jgi:hypothetical protein
MKKKLSLLNCLGMVALAAGVFLSFSTARADIITWVTDVPANEIGWTDHLSNDLGHTVNIRSDLQTLDATKLAALEASDLIIVGRQTNSGDYANDAAEVAQWNGITTPVLLLSSYLARNSRWQWADSATILNTADTVTVENSAHPAYAGLGVNNGDTVNVAPGNVEILNDNPGVGNGSLIGSLTTGGGIWIASWEAGTPYYAGSPSTPAGQRIFYPALISYPSMSSDGIQIFDNLVGAALIPEPSSGALMLLAGVLLFRRIKKTWCSVS